MEYPTNPLRGRSHCRAIGDYLASVKAVGEKLIERAADKQKAKDDVNGLVGPIEKWKQDLIDRPIDKQMDCENRFRPPARP